MSKWQILHFYVESPKWISRKIWVGNTETCRIELENFNSRSSKQDLLVCETLTLRILSNTVANWTIFCWSRRFLKFFRETVLFEKQTEIKQKLREIVLPMNSKCKIVNSSQNRINFTENHFTFFTFINLCFCFDFKTESVGVITRWWARAFCFVNKNVNKLFSVWKM